MLRTVDAERLLPTRDENRHSIARDHAPGNGAMDLGRLERILEDINNQPGWRAEADKSCDYYDGKQLDAETIEKLRERGLGELSQNLIKPTVDAVLGLEAKTRTDWMVVCEDERWTDVVDAANAKLKEAEIETRADRACSDAHAGQIKAGLQWVEVSRQTNPFEFPYRVGAVHRREIYWDWHSMHPRLDDARYLVRKRWQDADVVAAFFPQFADLISHAAHGWSEVRRECLRALEASFFADREHEDHLVVESCGGDLVERHQQRGDAGAIVDRAGGDAHVPESRRALVAGER